MSLLDGELVLVRMLIYLKIGILPSETQGDVLLSSINLLHLVL